MWWPEIDVVATMLELDSVFRYFNVIARVLFKTSSMTEVFKYLTH